MPCFKELIQALMMILVMMMVGNLCLSDEMCIRLQLLAIKLMSVNRVLNQLNLDFQSIVDSFGSAEDTCSLGL